MSNEERLKVRMLIIGDLEPEDVVDLRVQRCMILEFPDDGSLKRAIQSGRLDADLEFRWEAETREAAASQQAALFGKKGEP